MIVQNTIKEKLERGLSPDYLEVVNESANHSVPAGSESHFKVVAVSKLFEGQRLMQRHRQIYGLLAEEMKTLIHALALHTFTPSEWAEKQKAADSPACQS